MFAADLERGAARSRLKDAQRAASMLNRELTEAMRRARAYGEKPMTPEERQLLADNPRLTEDPRRRRDELIDVTRRTYRIRVDQLRAQVERDFDLVAGQAAKAIPRLP